MKISIDEEKCIGCGNCVPNCHLGIIEVRDGKARVLNPELCDGAGRCLGHCPTGALKLVDDSAASQTQHPLQHHQPFTQSLFKEQFQARSHPTGSCPGSRVVDLRSPATPPLASSPRTRSSGPITELRQWPVQLKLLPAKAPFFQNADLVLTADCVAYSRADFHDRFLRGRVIAIACPKLDSELSGYLAKLTTMFADAGLRSVQVLHMEVPCCNGLWEIARQAWEAAGRLVPLRRTILSIQGEIIDDAWASEQD